MRVTERQGASSVPVTIKIGTIIGGQCEKHGTVSDKVPATEQYTLCDCFKEVSDVHCTYCPPSKNPEEIRRISKLEIMVHPDDIHRPKDQQRVISVCNSFECSDRHLKRFKVSL